MNLIVTAISVLLALTPLPAAAGKFIFGDQEALHKIQDVNIIGPNDEDLYLGFRTKTKYFGLGIYVKDEGYVLLVDGDETKYIPLDDNQLKKFQKSGFLPIPMPEYDIGIIDYLFGYSLWLIILLVIMFGLIEKIVKRKSAREISDK